MNNPVSTYTIHPIITGLNATDQGIMTYQRHYGKRIYIPIYVFYLKGSEPDAPKILIDTGLEDFMLEDGIEEELGLKCEYFEDGLERLGLKPDDIDIIVHTHLHNDHCENSALCGKAKVYAQAVEIDFMRDPHPLDHRYDSMYLDDCDIEALNGDAEIVPGVNVVFTPGHSPGGQSVIVDTAESGRVLITGFCCNDLNFPSAGPAVCPGVHTDAIAGWESANRVKQMKESGEIDIIVPCHSLWPGQNGVIA
jgi:glyoxylase-like metal-dependent hydrolase (beta-lactamase superfamily II)